MPRKRRLPTGVVAAKRANGVVYRAWIPTGEEGGKHWLPPAETPEDAERFRADALREVARKMETAKRSGWTFRECSEATARDMAARCRPRTVAWFWGQMRALERALLAVGRSPESDRLEDLDADVWRAVRDRRLEEVSASSVAHHWRALRSVCKWARANGVLDRSPIEEVPPPRVRQREMSYLEEAELWRLVDAIEEHEHPHRMTDAAIFVVLFVGGLRRSELVRLGVRDVNLARRTFFLDGKVRNEVHPIGQAAIPYLAILIGDRVDGPVLLGGDNRLRRAFQRWAGGRIYYRTEKGEDGEPRRVPWKTSGLLGEAFEDITRRLHPHALRHSFVTALVAALRGSVTEKELLELTRLRSLTTLHRYLHVTADPARLDVLGAKRRADRLRILRDGG